LTGLYTLFQRFGEGAYVHRNPLFVIAVFLFMLGVQSLMMGLLAELQIRTYHEAQAKPTYLIGDLVNFEGPESTASGSGNSGNSGNSGKISGVAPTVPGTPRVGAAAG
jgi:hypothetical protein